ncbi:MAG TPA: hypothetical protein VF215_02490, partial [Thermoanaerobaculia bacterium]
MAIKKATAVLDNVTHTLTQSGNVFTKIIDVPNVDGTEDVPKILTIAAEDYQGNVRTIPVNVVVRPLIDPNAPALSWACTSPNALYPANYAVKLRVFAKGANAANGIQSVQFTIDDGAPVNGTLVPTDFYETTFTIPGGTAAGKIYNVTVRARTVGGNESVVTGTFEVVSGVELINSPSTIEANEVGFEDTTFIVRNGGVLTIIGPRTLRNLVVLEGGKVIHRQTSTTHADALTVDRFYLACTGTIDVDLLGLPKTTTIPGAGLSSQSSGASYIGRGGLYGDSNGTGQSGTTYGNLFHPELPGSGGYVGDAAFNGGAGGGVVRIIAATSATIDGTITAKGSNASEWGNGSGGAVWITTPGTLAGGGTINVRGGGDNNPRGGGGGGAVSLEYGTLLGELANNVDTSGGRASTFHGASGSLYLKEAAATLGELVIDNRSGNTHAATELPSFGLATVATAPSANVATLDGASYLGTWLTGHSVRVTAPDGSVRGTWKIANVTNDASTRIASFAHIRTQDAVAYDGYVVYAENGRDVYGTGPVKFFAARFSNGQWQYDTDSTFLNFTPAPGEAIVATFRKAAYGIVGATPIACPCTSIDGMPSLALISGELLINQSPKLNGAGQFLWSPFFDAHEIVLRPGSAYGVIVGSGGATVEFESGADVRAGDTLRGVYQFDKVTVRSGRVVVNDLLESNTPPTIAAGASLIAGNNAPVVDA